MSNLSKWGPIVAAVGGLIAKLIEIFSRKGGKPEIDSGTVPAEDLAMDKAREEALRRAKGK